MGLPASATRLLQYTNRKHDITNTLMHCSNQKSILARDMQRVSRNYQNALNSKIYKWSNNGGASYSALSYNNLMRPSSMNQNKAYLLTDLNGRVVVDSKYKKYAEIISEHGAYDDSIRFQLLSEATGVDIETLENIHAYHEKIYDAKIALDAYPEKPDPGDQLLYKGLQQTGIEDLLKEINISGTGVANTKFDSNGNNWASSYANDKGSIELATNENAKSSDYTNYCMTDISEIGNFLYEKLSEYLIEDSDKDLLFKAIEDTVAGLSTELREDKKGDKNGILEFTDDSKRHIKTHEFIEQILGPYYDKGGSHTDVSGYGNGTQDLIWYDTKSDAYKQYKTDLDNWQKGHEELVNEYNRLNSESGQLLTNDIEQKIDFYDELFSSIAEKGWVYNDSVTDDEYLNQMLQNNIFTITEVHRQHHCDKEKGHYYTNTYVTDIAGNMENIIPVTDEEAILEAQVEYENEKAIINDKETKIDLRMENLKTEVEAINNMIKGLESVMKDNIDRTMSITG